MNAYSPFTWIFDLKIVAMYFSQRLKMLLWRLLSIGRKIRRRAERIEQIAHCISEQYDQLGC